MDTIHECDYARDEEKEDEEQLGKLVNFRV